MIKYAAAKLHFICKIKTVIFRRNEFQLLIVSVPIQITFKARDFTFWKWSIYYKNSTFNCVEILYCFKRLLKGKNGQSGRIDQTYQYINKHIIDFFHREKQEWERTKMYNNIPSPFLKDLDWMPIDIDVFYK